jgi:hypothetical protein
MLCKTEKSTNFIAPARLGEGQKKQDREKIEGKFSITTTRYYFHLILLALYRKSNFVSLDII